MTEHPRRPNFADHARQETVAVEENVRLAQQTYRIRFTSREIARRILPEQFLMMRLAGANDPLLGRPLALYDVFLDAGGEPQGLDIVYLAVGKMTRRLTALTGGTPLEIWGPLGNGFPPTESEHLVMVAGGIGQTPFLALAREQLGLQTYGDPPRQVPRAAKVTLCYGARTAGLLAGVRDFEQSGVDVRTSTDDGTAGHHGLVTELIPPAVEASDLACRIACCGGEPMMAATAQLARALGLPCQVSLETPMACGIGICFSCVAKIRVGGDTAGGEGPGWDYRRTCVEGPVFDAEDVEF